MSDENENGRVDIPTCYSSSEAEIRSDKETDDEGRKLKFYRIGEYIGNGRVLLDIH